jgi:integrase
MIKAIFQSQFSDDIQRFVDEMHATGHKYNKGASLLGMLDTFIVTNYPEEDHLSKKIVILWTKRLPYEATSTQLGRISVIRGFAKFLCRLGKRAYVYPPLHHTIERYTYVPYIFTERQFHDILMASDSIRESSSSPNMHLILPAVFRLLYGCGLRISEAMNLCERDVDFVKGTLHIRDTKFRKERIIPMADSLTKYLKLYHTHVLHEAKPDDWLFPSPVCNNHYSEGAVYKHFRRILWEVGISHTGKGPRLHDIRHTYSIHCLKKWVVNGCDINERLAFLSIYLGHEDMRGTQHYLKLTADLYPEIIQRVNKYSSNIIPEVIGNEAD